MKPEFELEIVVVRNNSVFPALLEDYRNVVRSVVSVICGSGYCVVGEYHNIQDYSYDIQFTSRLTPESNREEFNLDVRFRLKIDERCEIIIGDNLYNNIAAALLNIKSICMDFRT